MDLSQLDISTLDFLPLSKELFREKAACQSVNKIGDEVKAEVKDGKEESQNKDDAKSEKTGNVKPEITPSNLAMEQLRAEVWGPAFLSPTSVNRKDRTFLQDGPCAEVAPKLNMCRECKMAAVQQSKPKGIFCRFFAFRSLRLTHKGVIQSNGFMLPDEATKVDKREWLPASDVPDVDPVKNPVDIAKRWNPETAVYILANVGDEFCELKEQEKNARASLPNGIPVAWKKAVVGVREMCDVCETTIFNFHWVCHRCGFVVCIDCHRRRVAVPDGKQENIKSERSPDAVSDKKDSFRWLFCSHNNRAHHPDRLVPTVIVPADCLERLADQIHGMREKWGIRSKCACFRIKNDRKNSGKDGVKNEGENDSYYDAPPPAYDKRVVKNEALAETVVHPLYRPSVDRSRLGGAAVTADHAYGRPPKGTKRPPTPPASTSDLIEGAMIATPHLREDPDIFAGFAAEEKRGGIEDEEMPGSPNSTSSKHSSSSSSKTTSATFKELLAKKKIKSGSLKREASSPFLADSNVISPKDETSSVSSSSSFMDALALKRARLNRPGRSPAVGSLDDLISSVVEHNSNPQSSEPRAPLTRPLTYYVPRYTPCRDSPIRIHALTETSLMYPDVPHSWICDGRLLLLHDPDNPGNAKMFQDQWKRGQPVLVGNVHKVLTKGIWNPEAFCDEFGHIKNDLVNCRNGHIMHALPMTSFWEGFANMGKRLVDKFSTPLVLKLKDWPPTEDFAELMPQRFGDLMRVLPMAAYTHRDGILNLAGRLPNFCVKPDLGPKMYNAYGMARYPQCGTTNLHLDMSDAVNVMVYIGKAGEEETIYKTIEEAGVDVMTHRRLEAGREDGSALPGALWHIFDSCDADAIRDLLDKVAKEIGEPIDHDHDPIHDQAWYLDAVLRDRLHKEYGVTGYAIVQCLGDSVFIPAGAPHQVLNLNSCIKAAEDFVSPEHVSHCFRLTQEFRYLSDTHTNHEDKLQVKNIIYHTVKDAVSVLLTANPDED